MNLYYCLSVTFKIFQLDNKRDLMAVQCHLGLRCTLIEDCVERRKTAEKSIAVSNKNSAQSHCAKILSAIKMYEIRKDS